LQEDGRKVKDKRDKRSHHAPEAIRSSNVRPDSSKQPCQANARSPHAQKDGKVETRIRNIGNGEGIEWTAFNVDRNANHANKGTEIEKVDPLDCAGGINCEIYRNPTEHKIPNHDSKIC
jgi:hypothetical protein